MVTKPEKEVNEMENTTNLNGKSKGSFLKDVKAEFKKVVWPSRKDARSKTVTVIVTSLIFGLIVFGMDTVIAFIYNAIIGLLM